jgi:hypothetical protein
MILKHVHRYQRRNIAKSQGKTYLVYYCSLPDCNHYLVPELVVGKKSICWKCGEAFILTADLARLAKPHCKKCGTQGTKRVEDSKTMEEFLKDFLGVTNVGSN